MQRQKDKQTELSFAGNMALVRFRFLYSAELFPTPIRASGIGSASFLGRIGGMIAPWIGNLGSFHPYLPVMSFGFVAFIAGLAALWLPETQGRILPYTVEEAEKLKIPTLCRNSKKQELTKTP